MSLTGKTLIAGFLAFLASFLLFCSAVYSDFARKKRKALVSRSFLPHSLVKIDCYLRDSFDEKNNQGNLCDNYERIRHHSDMIGLAFINGVVSRMYPYSRELVDYDFSFRSSVSDLFTVYETVKTIGTVKTITSNIESRHVT